MKRIEWGNVAPNRLTQHSAKLKHVEVYCVGVSQWSSQALNDELTGRGQWRVDIGTQTVGATPEQLGAHE